MRPLIPSCVLLSLLLAACGTAPYQAPPSVVCRDSDSAFAERAEALIAAQVDAQRAKLAPKAQAFRPDPGLTRVARARSCDMAHGARFSHTDADGHFIAHDMVRDIRGRFDGIAGENIGTGPPVAPEDFAQTTVQAWMESPEHRANILNPMFKLAGVGVAKVGDEVYVAQVFYGP